MYPSIDCPILSALCIDKAALNQNQKPVEQNFFLQIESRKNGLASREDAEKSDIHKYPIKI